MDALNAKPGARPRVLNVGRIAAALLERLAQDHDVTDLAGERDLAARLQGEAASFQALVTSAPVGVDAAMMAALPGLQVISSFGVGLDRIDLAAARGRGIQVGYTPHVLDDCVADTAMGLVLDAARGLSAADRYVRAGRWPGGPFPTMRKVSGARLGIVGMGRIGQQIAARAAGFRMEVAYHARQPVSGLALRHEPSLHALARWADFLVLALPGGAATRHIVDAAVLDALGPQGFLVNIARGSVVDERALVEALASGRIAGAGLDVYEHEPQVPARLLQLDNVVLLPHVGSNTRETRAAMADLVVRNLRAFFEQGQVVCRADPPAA
ncbi:2-hydroxyacid dehydrogenase [Azohydromonas lata]|uniref:2-hydroxyacid dehydrogenase n=1 Tax=Azohydromonas lata TaxID=45677 RepID=UPI00083646EC|nr:2-hydroxyacid dehydrogenase [Azohydromonas lata]